MIPEGHTLEDIKKREQIIRDFLFAEPRPINIKKVYHNGHLPLDNILVFHVPFECRHELSIQK